MRRVVAVYAVGVNLSSFSAYFQIASAWDSPNPPASFDSMPPKPAIQSQLTRHVEELLECRRCVRMHKPVVSGGPVVSQVMLVGQAPGDKEPKMGRPFAWTAGKTLFRWFQGASGHDEATVRAGVYFAAVCRCFPGKKEAGGDRVPDPTEIEKCAFWIERELTILQPKLVIPVGKLAIAQFIEVERLDTCIGRSFRATRAGVEFEVVPLPHPSGASPWHRMEPGKTLLNDALKQIVKHPAWRDSVGRG